MAYGKLVAFRVYKNNVKADKGKTVLNKFVQKFYGQTVSSHDGKHRHHVQGLLEDITHIKLVRSVIIAKEADLEKALQFLEKYGAEVHTRDITLTHEEHKFVNKYKSHKASFHRSAMKKTFFDSPIFITFRAAEKKYRTNFGAF